jgi:hypothetical protein
MVKLLASFSILEHRDSGIECIPARPRSIATLMLGSKTYLFCDFLNEYIVLSSYKINLIPRFDLLNPLLMIYEKCIC